MKNTFNLTLLSLGLGFLLLTLGFPLHGHADEEAPEESVHSFEFKGYSETRYNSTRLDGEDKAEKAQGRVRLGFVYNKDGEFELVGLISTGEKFNNDWAVIHDFKENQDLRVPLYFRRLYVTKFIGQNQLSIGGLEPFDLIGSSSSGSTGWIDGARFIGKTSFGNIKVILGSVAGTDNADIFTRSRKLNFMEIEVEQKLFEKLLLKSGVERFEGENYIKQSYTVDLKVLGEDVVKFIARGLYNLDTKGLNYDLGVQWDVLQTFLGAAYTDYFTMQVYHHQLDPLIERRNEITNFFLQTGKLYTFVIGGKVTKNGSLNWYTRYLTGDRGRRLSIGLSVVF